MKRYHWLTCLLALTLAMAPALVKAAATPEDAPKKKAPKKEPKAKGDKTGLRGVYGQIVSVCKLTPEETEKFKAALQPYFDAQKANKDKLAELSKAAAEARKAKDKDKTKDLAKQRKDIEDPMNALRDKAMDVLTKEQKALWEGHLLVQSMMQRYKKVELTEDQQNKIRELCAAKAKDMQEAADDKAKRAVRDALAKEVVEKLLTDEQKAKLKAPPKAPKEKPPAEKKPPKPDAQP